MKNQPGSANQAGYNQAFIWARSQLKAGVDAEAIVAALVGQGWEMGQARHAVTKALAAQAPQPRRALPPRAETFAQRNPNMRRPIVIKWGDVAFWGTGVLILVAVLWLRTLSPDERQRYLIYGGAIFLFSLRPLLRIFRMMNRD